MGRKQTRIIIGLAMVFIMFLFAGCVTTQTGKSTPGSTSLQAQESFLNAWDAYHKVWLALPETDPRKAEWLKKYHPAFGKAANLLESYRIDSAGITKSLLDQALDQCENILIQLAIKKGAR